MLLWKRAEKDQRQMCKVVNKGSHYVITRTKTAFFCVASGNWPHFLATPLMETFTLFHELRQRDDNLLIVIHTINSGSSVAGTSQAAQKRVGSDKAWAPVDAQKSTDRSGLRPYKSVLPSILAFMFYVLHHRDNCGALAYYLNPCVWELSQDTLSDYWVDKQSIYLALSKGH